jgi:hypothetical protein
MTPEQAAAYLIETDTGARALVDRGSDKIVPEMLRTTLGALLSRAFKMGLDEAPKPVMSELATGLLATIIPAQPGWRLAVLGPDEDLEACPIVAWATVDAGLQGGSNLALEPIARWHGQDGLAGASLNAGRPEHVVGILAPGEELDAGWINAGDELAAALREHEDREVS